MWGNNLKHSIRFKVSALSCSSSSDLWLSQPLGVLLRFRVSLTSRAKCVCMYVCGAAREITRPSWDRYAYDRWEQGRRKRQIEREMPGTVLSKSRFTLPIEISGQMNTDCVIPLFVQLNLIILIRNQIIRSWRRNWFCCQPKSEYYFLLSTIMNEEFFLFYHDSITFLLYQMVSLFF